jgi:protein-L-isoaspartate O-methyltransferase
VNQILLQLLLLIPALFFVFWMVFAILSIAKGAPFINSKKKAIESMIELAEIKTGMKTVDIGSGSGPIVIAFARAGAQATGYEINWFLVLWSRVKLRMLGLSGKGKIRWGNFWQQNLSESDVVTVYGIPFIMKDLEKKLLAEMKPGTKIISNSFTFPNLQVARQVESVYLYIVG